MEITKDSRYKDIRAYFTEQLDKKALPNTLQSECKYYRNVPATTALFIKQIDLELEKLEADPNASKLSAIANAAKYNLIMLYNDLQDKSKWDAPLTTIKEYLQERNQITKND